MTRQASPAETSLPHGKPADPTWMAATMFVLTPIGAGILLALNWRRLGKPDWMLFTLLLATSCPSSP